MMTDADRQLFFAALRMLPWKTRVWPPDAIRGLVATIKAQQAERKADNENGK